MTPPVRAAAACVGIAASIGLAVATLQARDQWYPRSPSDERLLYLTNGRVADRLSLSFDSVVSDVYWIRIVQYYARERKSQKFSGRYDLLYPLLDLTTTLDPHFQVAYQFGAIFLAEPPPDGAGRMDLAIKLLEKGLSVEPRWQYAEALGFLYYWHGHDLLAAAGEFSRAAKMPNAPKWLGPLTANMLAKGGDQEAARILFTELAKSEEKWIRELAERRLSDISRGVPR